MEVVDVRAHRGQFFPVLQETERSQSAVMPIAPGADAGPEEHHTGGQIIYVIEGEAVGQTPLFFPTVYTPPEY